MSSILTPTVVPSEIAQYVPALRQGNEAILAALRSHDIQWDAYPLLEQPGNPGGRAAARAHPMQGVLKYHGMSDWDWRVAYLPSVSLSNTAAYSLTLVEFDLALEQDEVWIGTSRATGRELERVQQTLNVVRRLARIESRARVRSRNVVQGARTGKGLGTSASASAALATAAIAAAFGIDLANNLRFRSCMARLLAGSGCRAAVGGCSVWLSYPGIAHEDSFAVRIDQSNQLRDLRLITVPVDSRIGLKTEMAHRDAPESPFFPTWITSRSVEVIETIQATQRGDWQVLGEWAEHDSLRLHGVTMTGSRGAPLIALEPEDIVLFRLSGSLRQQGIPVWFSADTGPTTVFLTDAAHEQTVVDAIADLKLGVETIRGGVAGGAELVDIDAARQELI